MKAKPNPNWLGTWHEYYGKIEDKEYELRPGDEKEPMWQSPPGTSKENRKAGGKAGGLTQREVLG